MESPGLLIALMLGGFLANVVVQTVVVGTSARVAGIPAPVGRVIGAVVLGDVLVVAAGLVMLLPWLPWMLASTWIGWAAFLLLHMVLRGVAFRLVLGGRWAAALSTAVLATLANSIVGAVVTWIASWLIPL